nr:conserved oligomeric Golgi complex subunit 4 [Tanacetum cinerariifolium]
FEKIDSPFQQTSSLKPYVLNVILEKIIIDLEDEVVNLLEKEKENLETIESLKSKGFESSETVIFESENQSENNCRVDEKECDKVKNSKVITPGMFKLNLDTFSSVRRPKHRGVIWKKKGLSNTSNVDCLLQSQSDGSPRIPLSPPRIFAKLLLPKSMKGATFEEDGSDEDFDFDDDEDFKVFPTPTDRERFKSCLSKLGEMSNGFKKALVVKLEQAAILSAVIGLLKLMLFRDLRKKHKGINAVGLMFSLLVQD